MDKEKVGVQYGVINQIQYKSTTTGTVRQANVLLPPGYSEDKKYPVLYLLHGIGGDENEWMGANPKTLIGNLVASGEAKEMVVVFPNVRARVADGGNPADIFSIPHFQAFDNFINDLRDNLMPFIKEHYSIATGRENTAIAGLSMGGREALYIGLTLPEVFGSIGAFSPAFGLLPYTNNDVTEEGLFTEHTLKLPDGSHSFILILTGDNDVVVRDEPLRYHKVLKQNGVEHMFDITSGGHDFKVWSEGLYRFVKSI